MSILPPFRAVGRRRGNLLCTERAGGVPAGVCLSDFLSVCGSSATGPSVSLSIFKTIVDLPSPSRRPELHEELDTHHKSLGTTNSQRPVRARAYQPVPRVSVLSAAWGFAGPKNPIGKKRRKKIDREKLASFGPLCLSSDGTPCQESESLSDFKNRRAGRPDFNLPFWTLYFRHYEVGAPCRRAYVWPLGAPFG